MFTSRSTIRAEPRERYHQAMDPLASRSGRSILAAVILFAGLAMVGCDRSGVPDGAAASDETAISLNIGDTVGEVRFRTLDGTQPRLADFAGPVLVNFWATSCAVCLEEAPDLVDLRERWSADGYEMISVAMPYDRPDAVLELASANGWTHPVAIDLDGKVLGAFEPIIGTPTNLLIGADGTLLERYVGRTDLGALERRLRTLLERRADLDTGTADVGTADAGANASAVGYISSTTTR